MSAVLTINTESLIPSACNLLWFELNFRKVILKVILVINGWGITSETALRWKSLEFTDDKSTLVQGMARCRQAMSHYLSQCWPKSLLQYGVTRPQWVNIKFCNILKPQDVCMHQRRIPMTLYFDRLLLGHLPFMTLWTLLTLKELGIFINFFFLNVIWLYLILFPITVQFPYQQVQYNTGCLVSTVDTDGLVLYYQ